jgi:DNA polymerase elongation subunit (family B)
MNRNSLDIETAPQPLEDIVHLRPLFEAPSNWKDPDKIAEKIAEQQRKWIADAALSPITGRVLVIGAKPFGGTPVTFEGDEAPMLHEFWQYVNAERVFDTYYGHNLHAFDIPFLIKRSWLHGIRVPMEVIFDASGRYVNDRRFVDTMVAFQCGDRRSDFISLDTVAKFFGFPGKTEDIGAQFATIYATDRDRAMAYLYRDLDLVEGIANRMFPHQQAA